MKAYLGIDVGSISTKGVVIDSKNAILASEYLWTEGDPMGAVRRLLKALASQLEGRDVQVAAVGTTGSARKLTGAMTDAQVVKNEITAHAIGTTSLYPDVRTIFEIGGQDSKIILVENGIVVDYAMNTLCAAGTGGPCCSGDLSAHRQHRSQRRQQTALALLRGHRPGDETAHPGGQRGGRTGILC